MSRESAPHRPWFNPERPPSAEDLLDGAIHGLEILRSILKREGIYVGVRMADEDLKRLREGRDRIHERNRLMRVGWRARRDSTP